MTINTTKDPQPDAKPDLAIEPSVTSEILGAPPARAEHELESRIRVRRAELVARLRELKVDRRLGAGESFDKLKARLSELSHLLKWGIVDGWASLGDKVKERLEHWLEESGHQLPTQHAPTGTGQS
jgi:hypothetical protein